MKVDISELNEGTLLERTIEREDGTLLLTKGTKLTNAIIQRLKRLDNIRFSEDELSNEEVEETVNPDLRSATEDSLKEFLKNPSDSNMEKIKENTKKIVETIEDTQNAQYDLEMYLKQTNDMSSHCVRVACFSILLAKIYNNNLKKSNQGPLIDLNDIAIAAVLQDVGTMYKDKQIPNIEKKIPDSVERVLPGIKDTPFDTYDEQYLPVYSYCAVAGMRNISSAAKLMILLSKEPETGDGCLKLSTETSKKRTDFNYGAKIINVCNMYDNSMKQTIDNGNSLEEVVSELGYYARNGIINNEIQDLLFNNVRLYPIKTRVVLSNGEVAVVENSRVGQQDSYKPVVHTRPYPGQRIDLKETTNVTIKSILSKEMFKKIVKDQIEDTKNRIVSGDTQR